MAVSNSDNTDSKKGIISGQRLENNVVGNYDDLI